MGSATVMAEQITQKVVSEKGLIGKLQTILEEYKKIELIDNSSTAVAIPGNYHRLRAVT